jgi:1A family penicillin-binding protein
LLFLLSWQTTNDDEREMSDQKPGFGPRRDRVPGGSQDPAPDIERKDEVTDFPTEKTPKRPWGIYALLALVVGTGIGLAGGHFLTPRCGDEGCPEIGSLEGYRPPEPAKIYDADGELAGQLQGPRRIVVSLDSIPVIVRDGYVAVEDRRFRSHGGVDFTGAFRAFAANLKSGGIAEGGSTITMQLARNVFGPDVLDWNRFRRKAAEIRIARRLEDQLTKDQILEIYLNQIYLGDGVYGVETASQHYFGKPVSQVSTREAALLIGLAKNPEGYNPRRDPFAAKDRIETVLDILVREQVIPADEAENAKADRVQLVDKSGTPEWGKNSYYFAAVRRELRELIPEPSQRQGIRVYTGLDQRAQSAGVDALVAQIRSVEAGRWGTFRHEAASGELPRMELSPYLQGMVVAMDPITGAVTTLVGGRDYDHSEFDRAFQAKRQPGSSFKPFVYAAALQTGVRLSDRVSTEPVRLEQRGTPAWEPGDHVEVPELTVRNALVHSSNSATVRIGQNVGIHRVSELAHSMGISTDIPPYPASFLGAGEVIPAELVAAYAPFANGGRSVAPHFITRIEDPHGHVVYEAPQLGGQRVLDARISFLMLDMMRDVVRRGTGWRVGASGLSSAAGKTGTTNDSRDVWFIGMTQSLLAGVWLGFDDPQTIVRNGSGGDLAAPVWARFMQVANRGRKAEVSWDPPPGIVAVEIDAQTGYRASPECIAAEIRTEYFINGTEPYAGCSLSYDGYWNGWGDSLDSLYNYQYQGDTLMDRLRRERQRYLDSLDALRTGRPWPPVDTLGVPVDTFPTPVDTLRPFPTPVDTVTFPGTNPTRPLPPPVDTVVVPSAPPPAPPLPGTPRPPGG